MILPQQFWRTQVGLGLITLSTLLLQLCLIRVLGVILNPVMGYMAITSAMFALGLGGVYVFIFRNKFENQIRLLPIIAVVFALSVLSLLPVFNWLPFNLHFEGKYITIQVLSWAGMYLALTMPFFMVGIIISIIFSNYSSESHRLYFFDLVGAGIGCLLIVPLIPYYGPGGLLFLVSGLVLLASFLLTKWKMVHLYYILPLLLAMMVFPLSMDEYLEFKGHGNKRGVDEWIKRGMRDYIKWDPVSKLDVFNVSPRSKNFALDGGQQGSWLQRFDGNYGAYHKRIKEQPEKYFFGTNSVAHYFKQNTKTDVLIIGAAASSEVKTALIFGAKHVDAIDLVKAMVDAVKQRYVEFSGGAFIHPKVDYRVGEGRTYLRSTDKKYDIIQMFSNHTSSSIANGAGVLSSVYLQTAEAYVEYFQHLNDDGILQINHHLYPLMIITAAQGWERLGKRDFAKHVLVLERWIPDNLPTLLIKMSPWTEDEVEKIYGYMNRERTRQIQKMPKPARPSERIYKNKKYQAEFTSRVSQINGISILIGTHQQERLDYDVTLQLLDFNGNLLASKKLRGDVIENNRVVDFKFTEIDNWKNKKYRIMIFSDNDQYEKGFSIWLTKAGNPVMQTIPRPQLPAYNIAFHPLELENNLIPEVFLNHPFPTELAKKADYRMKPGTDDMPHFNMIRKSNRFLKIDESKYLDGGTAYFLNNQMRRFLPYDWISIFVVGAVSLIFSLIFILIPFVTTPLGRAQWKGKTLYLLYFSCLGAGFIIIELIYIQIFTKLIGFPTYAFATVIFALLFSAGCGSVISKKLNLHEKSHWKIIFLGILVLGIIFTSLYSQIFAFFLGAVLPVRIFVSVVLIFPMGFFMGMPFPLGMVNLGRVEPRGIPWAWAMNGLFTVLGGYLSLVTSIMFGFQAVLFGGLTVYLVAFFLFWLIESQKERAN